MKTLRVGLVGFLLGMGSSAWLSAKDANSSGDTIRARKIEVIGANGKPRIVLDGGPDTKEGEPSIALYGRHGKIDILIGPAFSTGLGEAEEVDLGTGIIYRNRKGEMVKLMR